MGRVFLKDASIILATYKYRDWVFISSLGISGRIVGILVDYEIRYRVRIWDDFKGTYKIIACFDDELEVITEEAR